MTDQPYQSKFLVNPESNETFEVTDPQAEQDLLSVGLQPESKEQFVERETRNVVREYPVRAAAESFANQFTNQLALGLPQLIGEHSGSEDDQMKKKAYDKVLAEEHSGFNIAGGALGMGATLLATPIGKAVGMFGEAAANAVTKAATLGGEALAQKAATNLAAKAAQYGAENAAINIPYRVTEEILGDPKIASEGLLAHVAEDFGVGAALGGGVGLGTSLLGYAVKGTAALAKGLNVPEYLADKANQFQFKNTGGLTSEIRKLEGITGKKTNPEQFASISRILDENVSQLGQAKGPEHILGKFQEKLQETGQKLSEIRQEADTLRPGAVPYSKVSEALESLRSEYTKGDLSTSGGMASSSASAGPSGTDAVFQEALKRYGPDVSRWSPEVTDAVMNGTPFSPTGTPLPGMSIIDPRATADTKAIDFVKNAWQAEATKVMRASGLGDPQIAQAFTTGEGLPNLTLEQLHNFRKSTKEALFKVEKVNGFKTEGGTDAWNVLSSLMDDTITDIGKTSGAKDLVGSFAATNKKWRELYQVSEHLLEPAVTRAVARNKFGLGSTILAGAGAIAGGAPGTMGALAAGYVKQHYGNYIMYQTLGKAAKVLEGFDGRINNAVTEMLSSAPAKSAAKAAAVGSVGVWSRYLGEDKADPRKGLQALVTDLSHAQANPDKVGEALSALAPDLADHAPTNFALMSSNTMAGIQYLMDAAPKPPPPLFPGGPIPPWSPSDNEMSKYSRKVHAVFSPMSILDEVKTGTLTRESVEAVKTVYPNFYQAIQTSLKTKLAGASPRDILRIRSKLSYLIDDGVDPYKKATRIQMNQAGFAPNNKKVAPQANSKIDEASRYKTELDRIQQ